MHWNQYKKAFEFDGSLRDIYVLDTRLEDWQKFIDFVAVGECKFKYSVDGEEMALPREARTLLERKPDQPSGLLAIDLGGAIANCHFFREKDIELDIDPREFTGEGPANSLFDFMSGLAAAVEKDVILTEENSPLHLWFRFDASAKKLIFSDPFPG